MEQNIILPNVIDNYIVTGKRIREAIGRLSKKLRGCFNGTRFVTESGERLDKHEIVGVPDNEYEPVTDIGDVAKGADGQNYLVVHTDGWENYTYYINLEYFSMTDEQLDKVASDLRAERQRERERWEAEDRKRREAKEAEQREADLQQYNALRQKLFPDGEKVLTTQDK